MLLYIDIKHVDTPVHNCDIGVPLLYKALCFRPIAEQFLNVHVILCSIFEYLFEFQNRIFPELFVQVSSCSNTKPFEVRESTVFILLTYQNCAWLKIYFEYLLKIGDPH
jgi:hypothetical protein